MKEICEDLGIAVIQLAFALSMAAIMTGALV